MRQRETLVQSASDKIRHMQKALRQMNLLLENVVSDINGITGMKIIRAILDGERDPSVLAKFRDKRCQRSEKIIAASLEGHYQEEHLFTLKQSVQLYIFISNRLHAVMQRSRHNLTVWDQKGTKIRCHPEKVKG